MTNFQPQPVTTPASPKRSDLPPSAAIEQLPTLACVTLALPPPSGAALIRLPSSLREVAELVATGLSNAQIAARRGTSTRTIANQLAQLFEQLGVSSRCGVARCLELQATAPRIASALLHVPAHPDARPNAPSEVALHESANAA